MLLVDLNNRDGCIYKVTNIKVPYYVEFKEAIIRNFNTKGGLNPQLDTIKGV